MFTGIIEETGIIRAVRRGARSALLMVGAETVLADIGEGDSIAVDGVCLTVTSFTETSFSADVMYETLRRSTMASLREGSPVNLERAMPANGRFGGHIIAGHVDGVGRIANIQRDENAIWLTVAAPPEILKYIVEKGSVALDGVSLTVARVGRSDFGVSVIPHTAEKTTLSRKRLGDLVNIENDCIGKYVEKLMKDSAPQSGVTREFLAKFGY